jgi:glycosyltransferase involved in cell wall biosynthesis
MSSPQLSLVIAVYNKPLELQCVLAGCSRQSFSDFEVIVADDGSGPAIRDVVDEARRKYTFPIRHLWHEDLGWRKNVMLNNAVRASRSDYLVFIDGDCIPARHFLLDHSNEREPRRVLFGRRVETSERWSSNLTVDTVLSGAFESYGYRELWDGAKGAALRLEDGVRIKSPLLRKILLRKVNTMLGSNFSAWKGDLEAINGFDELYSGPGCGEDSDVQYRLSLIGVTGKSLRNLAIQYHLYHPLRPSSAGSLERFEGIKRLQQPRCEAGLQRASRQERQDTPQY